MTKSIDINSTNFVNFGTELDNRVQGETHKSKTEAGAMACL